ncbi:MAG: hypothetical protein P4M11_04730 [Candidatus Pacebacteria bacterium]|nr:hypothetical protein [Candidatus Paceibacterota bacterium]
MKNKLCITPEKNPRIDPVQVQSEKARALDSTTILRNEKTVLEPPPVQRVLAGFGKDATSECNNLTTQIMAKLADVKEKLGIHSGKGQTNLGADAGAEDEEEDDEDGTDFARLIREDRIYAEYWKVETIVASEQIYQGSNVDGEDDGESEEGGGGEYEDQTDAGRAQGLIPAVAIC